MTDAQRRTYRLARKIGPDGSRHALVFLRAHRAQARRDGNLLQLCAICSALEFAHADGHEKLRKIYDERNL